MNRIHQTIRISANVMMMTLAFSGCALISGNTNSEDKIEIIKVASGHAHLSRVTVTPNQSGLSISGEVHNKNDARGNIHGHVDVELIASNGAVLAIGSTRYFRGSPKSRASRFSIEVPVNVSQVRKVLVTHHPPVKENQ